MLVELDRIDLSKAKMLRYCTLADMKLGDFSLIRGFFLLSMNFQLIPQNVPLKSRFNIYIYMAWYTCLRCVS